jgi:hypothetical protein
MFSQNAIDILEEGMVSCEQWNPIVLRSFFVLEEKLLCHLINCYLYFARVVSFVSKMVLGDFSLFLEAGRRADATDAGGQTFWYTFESMG